MAEYSAVARQTVAPGETVVFTETTVPCQMDLVRHSDGTSGFILSGWAPNNNSCCCCQNHEVDYFTYFNANIGISEGGTAGEISVAISVDGSTVPASTMRSTPAAVQEFNNVSSQLTVPIFKGCCQSVAVRNTSTQPIDIDSAILGFRRFDLM